MDNDLLLVEPEVLPDAGGSLDRTSTWIVVATGCWRFLALELEPLGAGPEPLRVAIGGAAEPEAAATTFGITTGVRVEPLENGGPVLPDDEEDSGARAEDAGASELLEG